jgi:hypothetical protein
VLHLFCYVYGITSAVLARLGFKAATLLEYQSHLHIIPIPFQFTTYISRVLLLVFVTCLSNASRKRSSGALLREE